MSAIRICSTLLAAVMAATCQRTPEPAGGAPDAASDDGEGEQGAGDPRVDHLVSADYFGAAEELGNCHADGEDESTHAAAAAYVQGTAPERFVLAFARAGASRPLDVAVLESDGDRTAVVARGQLAPSTLPWVRAMGGTPTCGGRPGGACVWMTWQAPGIAGEPPRVRWARVAADGSFLEATEEIVGARHPAGDVGGVGTRERILLATIEDDPATSNPRGRVVARLLDPGTGGVEGAPITIASTATLWGGILAARRFHRVEVSWSASSARWLVAWDVSGRIDPGDGRGGRMAAAQVDIDGGAVLAPEPGLRLFGESCDGGCSQAVRTDQAADVNEDCRVKAFWLASHPTAPGGGWAFTKYGCGGNGFIGADWSVVQGEDTGHAFKALATTHAAGFAYQWMQARGWRDVRCSPTPTASQATRLLFADGVTAVRAASECAVSGAIRLGQAIASGRPGGTSVYLHTDEVCGSGAARLYATVKGAP